MSPEGRRHSTVGGGTFVQQCAASVVVRVSPHKVLVGALVGAFVATFIVPAPRRDEPPVAVSENLGDMVPTTMRLRLLAKRRIAYEAAASRRSLVEAAALFRELNRLPPAAPDLALGDWDETLLRVPVRTDEERLCRQVVEWVYRVLRSEVSPESAAEAVERLEAEWQEVLRRHGAIRLPDSAVQPPVQELLEAARSSAPRTGPATRIRD